MENKKSGLREFEIPLLNHTRYFGMFLASHGIPDSIVVLHMGTGCKKKGGLHLWDNMKECFSQVCWTEVSGSDIVSDSHEMLEDAILTNIQRRGAGCVAVAVSSVIDMTGFDAAGAVDRIRKKTTCPLIYFKTSGYDGDMYDGYAEFIREMLKRADWSAAPEKDTVNIIGHVFDRHEMDQVGNTNEIRRMLAGIGLKAGAFYLSGQKASQLLEAGRGSVNVSMPFYGAHGLSLEKETGRKTAMTDLPMGVAGSTAWLRTVGSAAGVDSAKVEQYAATETKKVSRLLDVAKRSVRGMKAIVVQPLPLAAACAAFALELGMEVSNAAILGNSLGGETEFRDALERFTGNRHESLNVFEDASWSDIEGLPEFSGAPGDRPVVALSPSIEMGETIPGNLYFVELGYPSNNKHFIYAMPYMGYNGAVGLAQRIMDVGCQGQYR